MCKQYIVSEEELNSLVLSFIDGKTKFINIHVKDFLKDKQPIDTKDKVKVVVDELKRISDMGHTKTGMYLIGYMNKEEMEHFAGSLLSKLMLPDVDKAIKESLLAENRLRAKYEKQIRDIKKPTPKQETYNEDKVRGVLNNFAILDREVEDLVSQLSALQPDKSMDEDRMIKIIEDTLHKNYRRYTSRESDTAIEIADAICKGDK